MKIGCCPFCGYHLLQVIIDDDRVLHVACASSGCDAQGAGALSLTAAIEAWNMRMKPEARSAKIESKGDPFPPHEIQT